MRRSRVLLVQMSLLFVLAFAVISMPGVAGLLSVRPVHAFGLTYTVSGTVDSTLCTSSVGATWNSGTSTCTISEVGWYVAPSTTLTIPSGTTLTMDEAILYNYGTVYNYGTIINEGAGSTIYNCTGTCTATIVNEASGTITNNQYIVNYGTFDNFGTITNNDLFNNECGGILNGNSIVGGYYQVLCPCELVFETPTTGTTGITPGTTGFQLTYLLMYPNTGTTDSAASFELSAVSSSGDWSVVSVSPLHVPGIGTSTSIYFYPITVTVNAPGTSGSTTTLTVTATDEQGSYRGCSLRTDLATSGTAPSTVPEFPLGMLALLGLALPAMILLKRKFSVATPA